MPLIDFAIITGLHEEFLVLRKLFPQFEELPDGTNVWYRMQVQTDTGITYGIIGACQDKEGPLDAGNLTSRIIKRWDPAYIVLVGIAGSFYKDVNLGDILVSQQVFYYDPAKATEQGIEYRPEGYPCSVTLIRQAAALLLDDKLFNAWRQSANERACRKAEQLLAGENESYRNALKMHFPNIHFGTVASGSLKIASEEKKKELVALHGKIIGTEMEGAGILHATFHEELPTPAIVIKGVSDKADKKMDQDDPEKLWRALAKENSVLCVLALIGRGKIRPVHTDQYDLDPTRGSSGDARKMIPDPSAPGAQLLAFPRFVVPKGPLTRLQIGIEAYGPVGSLAAFKRVIDYRDYEGNLETKTWNEGDPDICIEKPISAEPIGLFLMFRVPANRIVFRVNTWENQQEHEWNP